MTRWTPAAARHLQEVEQLRVQRRLAAGEVDDVQLAAVIGDQVVEDAPEVLDGHVEGVVVLVVDVADRAVEVAGAGDGDDRQADLLLVRVAGPAVERAAVLDTCRAAARGATRPRADRRASPRTRRRPSDRRTSWAPCAVAALAHPDRRVVGDVAHDLRRHGVLADAAQAGGLVDRRSLVAGPAAAPSLAHRRWRARRRSAEILGGGYRTG